LFFIIVVVAKYFKVRQRATLMTENYDAVRLMKDDRMCVLTRNK